jgi:amidase
VASTELHDLTLIEASEGLRAGQFSAEELSLHMLARISRLDSRLKSYATIHDDGAVYQAKAADEARAKGADHVLLGIPLGIKDLCATKDMPTHVGSIALRNWNPGVDATVVARLREAGAVFIGKTQMTEGAYAAHHPDIPPPVNPWNAETWMGVSSSGSGVATAARLCFGSLGTDTGGSIRFPSYCCGLTGLKPTWGRVSRANAFALSESLDHIGPMTRTAADAAAILGVIAGADSDDPTALQAPVPDYLGALDGNAKGLVIGLDEAYCADGVDPRVTAVIVAAVDVLRDAGAVIKMIKMPNRDAVVKGWIPFCGADAALAHEATYPSRASEYGPALSGLIDEGRAATGMEIAAIEIARKKFAGALAAMFEEVDMVFSPAMPDPPPSLDEISKLGQEEGDVDRPISYTCPHDMAGVPTITLLGGFTDDSRPIGFQLVGPRLSEDVLLRAGDAFPHATDWHTRAP